MFTIIYLNIYCDFHDRFPLLAEKLFLDTRSARENPLYYLGWCGENTEQTVLILVF